MKDARLYRPYVNVWRRKPTVGRRLLAGVSFALLLLCLVWVFIQLALTGGFLSWLRIVVLLPLL
jgi:hypothetical protein